MIGQKKGTDGSFGAEPLLGRARTKLLTIAQSEQVQSFVDGDGVAFSLQQWKIFAMVDTS